MSDTLRIGNIITTPQSRDAVHMAIAPVIAGCDLASGEHVCINDNGMAVSTAGTTVGIVDPFLRSGVNAGQRFWLFMYPGSITSLRHDWEHSAFPLETTVVAPINNEHTRWISAFASRCRITYDVLMAAADTWISSREFDGNGEYLNLGGLLEGEYVPNEFWVHYEAVREVEVPEGHKENFFSCSC